MSNLLAKISTDPTASKISLPVVVRRRDGKLEARFDAATLDNSQDRRHWANADGFSADAAANPAVRTILRNRCRYEEANNGYLKGIQKTHANFTVGTGPRLQLRTGDPVADRFIEKEFRKWSRKARLAKKLRTLRTSKGVSGESFAALITNSKLDHRVKLDVRLIEADRIRSDLTNQLNPLEVDGILYDVDGNPITYKVMLQHPGGTMNTAASWEFEPIPAEAIIHLYDWDRPEQHRGIPEISSSLPLFAQLRRYTLAVVAAAEYAANNSGVMQTTSTPDQVSEVEAGATMEIERNTLTALPEGWTLSQMKAEQPTQTYGDFKSEIINEAARPLNMPFNIAAGNSSKYNYASGRLDHQVYFKSIEIEQDDLEIEVVDRIFEAWIREAILIEGYLPQSARKIDVEFDHEWFWDGVGHVDPVKDASAQDIRLKNHSTTLADEYARDGKDWEAQLEQRAKELERMTELGIPFENPQITETITDPNATADEGETADA